MVKIEDWLKSQLAIDIWTKKYRNGNESFEQWLNRVSGGNKEVRKLILDKKFLFAGRILANRGTDNSGTLSNCYVLSVKDSIESIYETAGKMAMTYKAGGGVGVDISSLAPRGAIVNNAARTTSGAVSFIDLFTTTTGLIGQAGRRGALMVSLSCDHPDIKEFIELKTDVNKATTANLSIRVTDDFMRAVQNDEDWFCAFTRKETGECISKVFKAKDLFKIFCDANYDYGEPGLLFWDTIERYNMLNTYPNFKFAGVNPCFKGDTLILTEQGYFPIRDICGKDVNIWNGYEWSMVRPRITGYNQPMYRVDFSDGTSIECTDYHKFILKGDKRIACEDLRIGDKIEKFHYPVIQGYNIIDASAAYTNGFFSGDGFLIASQNDKPAIHLYGAKKKVQDFLSYDAVSTNEWGGRKTIYLKRDGGMRGDKSFDKTFVPDCAYTIRARLDWLAGLLDSDGTINDKCGSTAITSINLKFLKDVKLMLSTLGVHSSIIKGRDSGQRLMPANDGTEAYKYYDCKATHRLIISASNMFALKQLGLGTHRLHLVANPNRDASRFITVKSLTRIKNEPVVYCMTEPKNHSVIANGLMTAQCAEECLPDGGACLLGSMNLSEYVKNDMTFDFTSFGNDVEICIKALDDVQSEGLELHPIGLQKKTARDWRQIGLGIMGLGDMLIKMNIRYGSRESLDLCDKIGNTLAITAIMTSIDLGQERGSFPMYGERHTESSEFYKAHMVGKDTMVQAPTMRNSQLLCIAPTGSISTMLGISGGIEPLYALEYERTTKSLHGGDMTYKVIPEVVQYARDRGFNNGLVCAADIGFEQRIAMQAVWQKHIDSSISSTVNLPKDFPREKIGALYMSAWKAGLKGITVFRDGCKRAGILTKEKSDTVKETDIIGVKRTVRTGCGNLHIVAMFNKNDGSLSELYLNRGSEGGCNSFMVGLSRMVSLSARNGVSLDKIVDQLTSSPSCPSYAVRRAMHKDTAPGNCCPSAVGKALLEMSRDVMGMYNTRTEFDDSVEKCPECGAPLVHTNSCKSCQECGWSKCS